MPYARVDPTSPAWSSESSCGSRCGSWVWPVPSPKKEKGQQLRSCCPSATTAAMGLFAADLLGSFELLQKLFRLRGLVVLARVSSLAADVLEMAGQERM